MLNRRKHGADSAPGRAAGAHGSCRGRRRDARRAPAGAASVRTARRCASSSGWSRPAARQRRRYRRRADRWPPPAPRSSPPAPRHASARSSVAAAATAAAARAAAIRAAQTPGRRHSPRPRHRARPGPARWLRPAPRPASRSGCRPPALRVARGRARRIWHRRDGSRRCAAATPSATASMGARCAWLPSQAWTMPGGAASGAARGPAQLRLAAALAQVQQRAELRHFDLRGAEALMAAAAALGQQLALGLDRAARRRMIDVLQQAQGAAVLGAAFDAERPLRRRRRTHRQRQQHARQRPRTAARAVRGRPASAQSRARPANASTMPSSWRGEPRGSCSRRRRDVDIAAQLDQPDVDAPRARRAAEPARRKSGARLMRRGEEVPRVMPRPAASRAGTSAANTAMSCGCSRCGTAARRSRGVRSRLRSLYEWTVKSIAPSSSALSISAVKNSLPSTDDSGRSWMRSPRVSMPTSSTLSPVMQAFEAVRDGGALCTCQQRAARAELDEAGGHASNETEGGEIFPAVRVRGVGAERGAAAPFRRRRCARARSGGGAPPNAPAASRTVCRG